MSRDDLPPLLDFDRRLERIESEADADVGDETDRLRELLEAYRERDSPGTGQESVVDDMENVVVGVRERVSGDAELHAEGIENRLQQYRDERTASSDVLELDEPRLDRDAEYGAEATETAAFAGAVVNGGEDQDGAVRLTFFGDGRRLRTVELVAADVGSGERREVEATVVVPPATEYYDATVVDESGLGGAGG